jgi:hypothetical protein
LHKACGADEAIVRIEYPYSQHHPHFGLNLSLQG